VPAAAAPKVPDLGPIQFDPVPVTGGPAAPTKAEPDTYATSPPPVEDDRPYRRSRYEKRDPEYCFNHQRKPKTQACNECGEAFCAECLAVFQGVLLCGPCKNFRARKQELPPAASAMATASLIITLISGPLMLCLLMAMPGHGSMRVLSWLSLLPQMLALALGIWALRDAERDKKAGGQWVALSGVATAGLTCLMIVLLNAAANRLALPS
jgi:hypothetical protein